MFLHSLFILFVVQGLSHPINDSNGFIAGISEPDKVFNYFLISLMTFNLFVLKSVGEFSNFFIIFTYFPQLRAQSR